MWHRHSCLCWRGSGRLRKSTRCCKSLLCKIRRCTLRKHRQECLCHTHFRLSQHSPSFGRIHVAQTLLSVLARLGTAEKINPLLQVAALQDPTLHLAKAQTRVSVPHTVSLGSAFAEFRQDSCGTDTLVCAG